MTNPRRLNTVAAMLVLAAMPTLAGAGTAAPHDNKVVGGIQRGADATGRGIERAGAATERGVNNVSERASRPVRRVGEAFGRKLSSRSGGHAAPPPVGPQGSAP